MTRNVRQKSTMPGNRPTNKNVGRGTIPLIIPGVTVLLLVTSTAVMSVVQDIYSEYKF